MAGRGYTDMTDAEIARQYLAMWDISDEMAYRLQDAQVQLGYGRVDPALLSGAAWEHIDSVVRAFAALEGE